jgi:hypothetical protein
MEPLRFGRLCYCVKTLVALIAPTIEYRLQSATLELVIRVELGLAKF